MTVKELIAILKKCPKDAIVIMSNDSNGNRYKELSEIQTDNLAWDPNREETGYQEMTDELRKMGFHKDDLVKGSKAIILWPED